MGWEAIFGLVNLVALAGWAMLAFLPRRPMVMAIVLFFGVALLCFIYAVMFVTLFGGLVDPVRVPGAAPIDYANYSVDGLRPLFMSDGGIVLGWTHYLAFDLFVGQWIARDADNKGFHRLVQLPILFLTLMAGPIGLFLWLLIRERRARAMDKGA